tara:strand:+ start:290 stop:505 length:216 start_codon:yes stop_codon:yes gene_type:complete
MMDTIKSFLKSIMDVALVAIPLSVVLGLIFPTVPFIGTQVVANITGLIGGLGDGGLVGIIVLLVLLGLYDK